MSHDPSEIILICRFAAQETFIIINVESRCIQFRFRILWWIESSKEQHLSEKDDLYKCLYTVTFDQFNAKKKKKF